MSEKQRILATNGGGTLGLYELIILAEIENKYCVPQGKTLRDFFDLIVGSSIGSMTAAAVAHGVPLSTMIDPLKAVSSHIFPKDSNAVSKTIRLIKTANGEAYDYKRMKDVCKFFFNDDKMKDIPKNLCIISYCIDRNTPMQFSSKREEDKNISIVDVVMAGCSIPSGFPPYKIGDLRYCDGFPYADDAALCAQMQAIEEGRQYTILAIGNLVQIPKEGTGNSLLNGDHINAMIQMTTQCAFLRSRKTLEKLCSLTQGQLIYCQCLEFPTITTVVFNNSEPSYLEEITKCAQISFNDLVKNEKNALEKLFTVV